LNQIGIVPVVLDDERCCGHDLLWYGDVTTARRLAEHNLKQLHNAGVRRVIFLCPECQHTFEFDYPQLVGKTGLELMHIASVLVAGGFKPGARDAVQPRVVTYHDPCWLGRQLGIYEPPRQLIAALPDVELREMAHTRQQALCCGGTSWLECGAAVKLLQERRLAEARAAGAELMVTACTKCEIHLRCALIRTSQNQVAIVNLIDLISELDKIANDERQ
jgi:Fe-S oxidoreductase